MQAIRGHADLMHRRRPVDEVIADTHSPQELRHKLELVTAARDFAVADLSLPDNKSYRSYADLERSFVVWNVIAAPEFALEPKTWCFPVAGCVAYRGYFSEDAARKFAQRLGEKGFDTTVGGVAAYSTLGRFADPVLNTMLRWSDVDLISTMFHELGHQKLYVKGDSAFNESFATAVADIGIRRWLSSQGVVETISRTDEHSRVRRSVMSLVFATRQKLLALYAEEIDAQTKRARKAGIFAALSADAGKLIEQSGIEVGNWLAPPLNNARLVSLNLYEGRSKAFQTLLLQCADELDCFYRRAEELAAMSSEERAMALDVLGKQGGSRP